MATQKKKQIKNTWLNPNTESNSSAINHVARTPESEEIKEDKLPKQKRLKKKDDPNRMPITMGKYKRKKKNN